MSVRYILVIRVFLDLPIDNIDKTKSTDSHLIVDVFIILIFKHEYVNIQACARARVCVYSLY